MPGMSGGPAPPSAVIQSSLHCLPLPFKSWRPALSPRQGHSASWAWGWVPASAGRRTLSTASQSGLRGHRAPLSPHPPLDPLPGREGEILTSRTFDSPHSASRVSSSPLVSSEGTSLQALSVAPAPEPGSRFFPFGPRGGDRLRSGSARDHPETRTRSAGPRLEAGVTKKESRTRITEPSRWRLSDSD